MVVWWPQQDTTPVTQLNRSGTQFTTSLTHITEVGQIATYYDSDFCEPTYWWIGPFAKFFFIHNKLVRNLRTLLGKRKYVNHGVYYKIP